MRKIGIFALFIFSFLVFAGNGFIKIPVITDVGALIANSGRPISFAGRFTLDTYGNMYIQDMDIGNIAKFTPAGRYVKDLLQIGTGRKEISSLKDFYIFGEQLYVIDNSFKGVKVYDLDGNFLFAFKTQDVPYSIAVSQTGEIYVPDYSKKNRKIISVYSPQGKFVRSFGDPFYDTRFMDKKKNMYLNRTLTIKLSPRDEVYVLSHLIPSIRKYSPTRLLMFERKIEGKEVSPGAIDIYEDTVSIINSAVDLGVDEEGYFMVSLSSTCAYLFSPEGALIGKVGVEMEGYIQSPQKFSLVKDKIASVMGDKIYLLNYGAIKGKL